MLVSILKFNSPDRQECGKGRHRVDPSFRDRGAFCVCEGMRNVWADLILQITSGNLVEAMAYGEDDGAMPPT